jgi:hypothetical protein
VTLPPLPLAEAPYSTVNAHWTCVSQILR